MDDLERLKDEYRQREERLKASDIYSSENPAHQFMRTRLYGAIERLGVFNKIARMKIFEIGCGNGNVLEEFYQHDARHLFGMDLLLWRLQQAGARKGVIPLVCGDGQDLPYSSNTFDIVVQFTVFSSILDNEIKKRLASEMKRVLKSNGLILWYDFFWNPFNRQTRGIHLSEIKSLFDGMQVEAQKETLAPPLTRRLIHVSPSLCSRLEGLRIFNSHYLALIKPLK